MRLGRPEGHAGQEKMCVAMCVGSVYLVTIYVGVCLVHQFVGHTICVFVCVCVCCVCARARVV